MKICVTGYSGAGKSTLAKFLGEIYNLPVLHLDATFWYGNWQHRTREEQTKLVRTFMTENPQGWVIDGNYFHICLERFEECDSLFFLNYNRFFCFKEAVKRYKKYKGTARGDCPCKEKFGFRFAFCRFFCAAHGFSSGNFELLADIDASGALGHAVGRPDIADTHAEFFGDFIEVVAAAHGVGSCLGLGLFGARRTLGT